MGLPRHASLKCGPSQVARLLFVRCENVVLIGLDVNVHVDTKELYLNTDSSFASLQGHVNSISNKTKVDVSISADAAPMIIAVDTDASENKVRDDKRSSDIVWANAFSVRSTQRGKAFVRQFNLQTYRPMSISRRGTALSKAGSTFARHPFQFNPSIMVWSRISTSSLRGSH